MPIELWFIIVSVLIVLAIIFWPKQKHPSQATEQYRLRPVSLPSADSGQRFGYCRSPMPAPTTDDDRFIVEDAGDTEPAVVDVVDLALRVGHELVEAVHAHPDRELACVDPNRVDATGEPLPPRADETACSVEPETPVADTDTTTANETPDDAVQSET